MHRLNNGLNMNRKWWLAGLLFCLVFTSAAQKKNFTYKFYGQVRGDLFYNSRANGEIVDGLFHLYPKDHAYDADGNDLNAQSNSSFYLLYSRLGIDMTGPSIGKIATSAKIETDFRGTGTSFAILRIRHAYVNLAWKQSALLSLELRREKIKNEIEAIKAQRQQAQLEQQAAEEEKQRKKQEIH